MVPCMADEVLEGVLERGVGMHTGCDLVSLVPPVVAKGPSRSLVSYCNPWVARLEQRFRAEPRVRRRMRGTGRIGTLSRCPAPPSGRAPSI